MGRLERGVNQKIDNINDMVEIVINSTDTELVNDSMTKLLQMFKPLMLKICSKWSVYFNDERHNIKQFSELMADAEYWFAHYTMYKYTIDGDATFNTFIKNHLDQRIRYIYEAEIKHYNKLVFPDPDRRSDDDIDMFESVVYNYSSQEQTIDIENSIIIEQTEDSRYQLAQKILYIINVNGSFNERERTIFTEIICNGTTHNEMGIRLNISRTRVTQILRKVKAKLYRIMNESQDIWDLVDRADIDFKEM